MDKKCQSKIIVKISRHWYRLPRLYFPNLKNIKTRKLVTKSLVLVLILSTVYNLMRKNKTKALFTFQFLTLFINYRPITFFLAIISKSPEKVAFKIFLTKFAVFLILLVQKYSRISKSKKQVSKNPGNFF
jgi:hypothetical protein